MQQGDSTTDQTDAGIVDLTELPVGQLLDGVNNSKLNAARKKVAGQAAGGTQTAFQS